MTKKVITDLFPVPEPLQRMYNFYGRALGVMADILRDHTDNPAIINALQDRMHGMIDQIHNSLYRWQKQGLELNAGMHPEVQEALVELSNNVSAYIDSQIKAEHRVMLRELHEFEPENFMDEEEYLRSNGKDSDAPIPQSVEGLIAEILANAQTLMGNTETEEESPETADLGIVEAEVFEANHFVDQETLAANPYEDPEDEEDTK